MLEGNVLWVLQKIEQVPTPLDANRILQSGKIRKKSSDSSVSVGTLDPPCERLAAPVEATDNCLIDKHLNLRPAASTRGRVQETPESRFNVSPPPAGGYGAHGGKILLDVCGFVCIIFVSSSAHAEKEIPIGGGSRFGRDVECVPLGREHCPGAYLKT